MSGGVQLGDLVHSGYRPGRHTEPEVEIALRLARFAARVDGRDEFGRIIYGDYTAGDMTDLLMWPATNASAPAPDPVPEARLPDRDLPRWGEVFPAITGPSDGDRPDSTRERVSGLGNAPATVRVRPIADDACDADNRFQELRAATAEAVPPGTRGVVLCAMHEHRQIPIFLPAMSSLVAVHRAGDPAMGSYVYDLDADNTLADLNEQPLPARARLHTMMRVVRAGPLGGCQPGAPSPLEAVTSLLGWQMGSTGQDGILCGGLVCDSSGEPSTGPDEPEDLSSNNLSGTGTVERFPGESTIGREPSDAVGGTVERGGGAGTVAGGGQVIAAASARLGGPFEVGAAGDVHQIGSTAAGEPINPVHLSTRTLFYDDRWDCALEFSRQKYEPTQPGNVWFPVELRIDKDRTHSTPCGTYPNLGRWEARGAIYFVPPTEPPPEEPPPEEPPPDEPPSPTPEEPPGGGGRTRLPGSPGQPGGGGGGGGGGGEWPRSPVGPWPEEGGTLLGPGGRGGRGGGSGDTPGGGSGAGGGSMPPWWTPDAPLTPGELRRMTPEWHRLNSTRRLGPTRRGGTSAHAPGALTAPGDVLEEVKRLSEEAAAKFRPRISTPKFGEPEPGEKIGYAASVAPIAAPSFLFRPQLRNAAAPDYRRAPEVSSATLSYLNGAIPMVGQLVSFAAQTDAGEYAYGTDACLGRWSGGDADGVTMFLPPDLGEDDIGSTFVSQRLTSFGVHRDATWGHGLPNAAGTAIVGGWRQTLGGDGNLSHVPYNGSGIVDTTREQRFSGILQVGPSDLVTNPTLRFGPAGSPTTSYNVAAARLELAGTTRVVGGFTATTGIISLADISAATSISASGDGFVGGNMTVVGILDPTAVEWDDGGSVAVAAVNTSRVRWANARAVLEVSDSAAPYETIARGLGTSEGRWGGEEARLIDPAVLTATPHGYQVVGTGGSEAFSTALGGSTAFTSAAIAGEFRGVATVNAFYTLNRTARFSCALGRDATATTSIVVAGLTGAADPSAGTPDGCYFRATDGGNLFAVTRTGGAETATDTTIGLAADAVRYLRVETSAATVRFFVDGILRATHTTNLPAGATTHFALAAVEASAAAARALRAAWVSGRQRTDS